MATERQINLEMQVYKMSLIRFLFIRPEIKIFYTTQKKKFVSEAFTVCRVISFES